MVGRGQHCEKFCLTGCTNDCNIYNAYNKQRPLCCRELLLLVLLLLLLLLHIGWATATWAASHKYRNELFKCHTQR